MNSKDELLAKLRAIDAEPPAAEPELKAVSPPAPVPASAARPGEHRPEISRDEFLSQLAALDEATRPAPTLPPSVTPVAPVVSPPPQPSASVAPPAASTAAPARARSPKTSSKPASSGPVHSGLPTPNLPPKLPNVIERLKQFTQAQLAAHAAENRAKAERLQKVKCAQAWLDQLDPLSDDGFWFEQFAERYESRLEAALDFLNPEASQS